MMSLEFLIGILTPVALQVWQRRTTLDRTPLDEWSARQQTDIHA